MQDFVYQQYFSQAVLESKSITPRTPMHLGDIHATHTSQATCRVENMGWHLAFQVDSSGSFIIYTFFFMGWRLPFFETNLRTPCQRKCSWKSSRPNFKWLVFSVKDSRSYLWAKFGVWTPGREPQWCFHLFF